MKALPINDFLLAEWEQREAKFEADHQAALAKRRADAEAERERIAAENAKRRAAKLEAPKRRPGQHGPSVLTEYTRQRIRELRLNDAPVAMIARYVGVSPSSVRRALAEAKADPGMRCSQAFVDGGFEESQL